MIAIVVAASVFMARGWPAIPRSGCYSTTRVLSADDATEGKRKVKTSDLIDYAAPELGVERSGATKDEAVELLRAEAVRG